MLSVDACFFFVYDPSGKEVRSLLEIVLASVNQDYVQRFARYVRTSHWNDKVRLHSFTKVQSLIDFCTAESTAFRFVLLDDQLYEACNSLHSLQAERIYRFVKTVHDEQHELQMYQPLSQLLQALYDSYVEQSQHDHSEGVGIRGECKITAVVSPYGGSGVTTVAFALSRALAMRDEKVLYVNLELYPKPHIVADSKYDFSRLLYILTTRPDELDHKWHLYCAPHEPSSVHCFRPAVVKRDLRDVKSEHLNMLFEKFQQYGFSQIVLDADAHWLDDLLEQQIQHDECWIVVPWNRKELHDFPELAAFVNEHRVKLIVNQVQAMEHAPISVIEEKADIVIPHIRGAGGLSADLLSDEAIPTQLLRMLADPVSAGGE